MLSRCFLLLLMLGVVRSSTLVRSYQLSSFFVTFRLAFAAARAARFIVGVIIGPFPSWEGGGVVVAVRPELGQALEEGLLDEKPPKLTSR